MYSVDGLWMRTLSYSKRENGSGWSVFVSRCSLKHILYFCIIYTKNWGRYSKHTVFFFFFPFKLFFSIPKSTIQKISRKRENWRGWWRMNFGEYGVIIFSFYFPNPVLSSFSYFISRFVFFLLIFFAKEWVRGRKGIRHEERMGEGEK